MDPRRDSVGHSGLADPGPHSGLGAIFRPLDLVDDAAVAGRVRKDAGADRRLVGRGRVKQRIDVRRQSIHPQMRHLGDLADRDGSLRPQYRALGIAHFGQIGLQQVGAYPSSSSSAFASFRSAVSKPSVNQP
jgi:hypothetical protein